MGLVNALAAYGAKVRVQVEGKQSTLVRRWNGAMKWIGLWNIELLSAKAAVLDWMMRQWGRSLLDRCRIYLLWDWK
jgi:hypothetical protein